MPSRPLRTLLLHLLLLAVFFNTTVGLSLHALEHLEPAAIAQQGPADAADLAEGEGEHLCEWCASFAQATSAPSALPPARPAPAPADTRPLIRRFGQAAAADERWPFRSRDPPTA